MALCLILKPKGNFTFILESLKTEYLGAATEWTCKNCYTFLEIKHW
jgi:hypothetical protein